MTELLDNSVKSDSEALAAPEGTDTPKAPESVSEEHTEPREGTPEVVSLRNEAASNRIKAKEAQEALDTLTQTYRALLVQHHAAGILADPTDLQWSDEFTDPEAIKTAAHALVQAKPHTGRVSGSVGQGEHGETKTIASLSQLLRAAGGHG